ncbi:hypothetical protein AB1Y20_013011 [Prymnesium parvum]|uniref:DNA/pantothenate metabolism flavoprotein C-terminal domain-containing protein n=1 Tax=Prymnesium parvum TaxID=97485 RepID=A0AB34IKY1_PRYPA
MEFFAAATPPPRLDELREIMDAFVAKMTADHTPVACVTSGGTTVPLERNTVRFIDNFSTGNRGAASVERFLEEGYAVIFVHRAHSAFPFARAHMPPAVSPEAWLTSSATSLAEAAAKYRTHASRLLSVPFTTVSEYLFLLRETARALDAAGPAAIIYLAAAVSDYYVPEDQMVEHKIQSGATSAEHTPGGLVLKLWPVPKLLGELKRAKEPWAANAFVVGFKLETNRAILLAKAAGSIAKYGLDVVCANMLQSYKSAVTLVTQHGCDIPTVTAAAIQGDETEEAVVTGIDTQVLCAQPPIDMEDALVRRLVEMHKVHQRVISSHGAE